MTLTVVTVTVTLFQAVFIIDSVLEPLLPIQIRNASFTQDVTAGKLLEK